MNENTRYSESSLLLRLPKNVLHNDNFSGNSLIPVAAGNVSGSDNASNPSNVCTDLSETTSVCQLQQPLLMSKGSNKDRTPEFNVPCTELNEEAHLYAYGIEKEGNVSDSRSYTFAATTEHPIEKPTNPNVTFPEFGCHQPTLSMDNNFTQSGQQSKYVWSNVSSDYQSSFSQQWTAPLLPNAQQECYGMSSAANLIKNTCPENLPITEIHALGKETNSNENVSQMPFSASPSVSQSYYMQYPGNFIYEPIKPYWCFCNIIESREIWYGFSNKDSRKLEATFLKDPDGVVAVDGGRYDAFLSSRVKRPVYFEARELKIQRCTWFYRPDSSQYFIPFPEEAADLLEENYKICLSLGKWQCKINLPSTGCVVLENSQLFLLYKNEVEPWPSLPDSKAGPKSVKRGLPENFEVMPDEDDTIDHLVFIVQGIGSFCDLKFRTVVECVDGFRDLANNLLMSHFKNKVDCGRVEFLPLAWHGKLHANGKGFDRCMQNITLPSIPKLRHFTNDTLLDILLYSSPSYCQTIIDTVANELNRLYTIFLTRNPTFKKRVSVAGHSLGSLILFDILSNQKVNDIVDQKITTVDNTTENTDQISVENLLQSCTLKEKADIETSEVVEDVPLLKDTSGESGISTDMTCLKFPLKESPCMSTIIYPRLYFEPTCFFALGSPISMFLTVRGYNTISKDFKLPTCSAFFHIFHPYDPVAFRIEPLIDPNFTAKPVLIPHHKGRKRMHLEIRESLSKVGFEIKQKVLETLRYTWNSLSGRTFPSAALEAQVDKLVEEQMSTTESSYQLQTIVHDPDENVQIGLLNGGRRIDYVLQEKPIEALNDYVFALTSHSTYWDSEDTVLMILREIYAAQGIHPSSSSAEVGHLSSSTTEASVISDSCSPNYNMGGPNIDSLQTLGINPTHGLDFASVPPHALHTAVEKPLGPPPLTGFVKRSPFAK